MSTLLSAEQAVKTNIEQAREDLRKKMVKFTEQIVGEDLILAITKRGKPIRAWAYDPGTGEARGSRSVQSSARAEQSDLPWSA